ncbi:MAG: hypothetical protein JOZ18_05455 [Chloroflexi bacterium]|nr:hypothetical protein [Chloroflexota bacterium]
MSPFPRKTRVKGMSGIGVKLEDEMIEQEGIVLLSYQPLQKVWHQFRSSPT